MTHKRFVLATAVFIGFPVFSMLLLELLMAVEGLREWKSVAILIMFGALTGAVAFQLCLFVPGSSSPEPWQAPWA